MKTQKPLSRREFLKVTGVIAGSAWLSACSSVFEIPLSPTPTSLPTLTNNLIPTNTSTPVSTPTVIPTETAIPLPEYSLPLTPEGEFDWSKFDEYPQLQDLNVNPGGDLYNFIQFCERKGWNRDYTQGSITEVGLRFIDNRLNTVNNIRDIAMVLDANHLIAQGTEPVNKIAGARVTFQTGNTVENMFIQLQQFYVPEAKNNSITVVTILPDQTQQRGYIVNLNDKSRYLALCGAFNSDLLNGKIAFDSQVDYDAYLLHQLGLTQKSDEIMLRMFEKRKFLPEASNGIFIGEISPIMVQ